MKQEFIVGVISDTHGLLRPEAVVQLQDCDLIVHAGDIGSLAVIEGLSKIAPVNAIKGNIDKEPWAEQFPSTRTIEVGRTRIFVLHNLKELDLDPTTEGFQVVISGHSHKPKIHEENGVLYLNPGSAGPRRFKLPVTVAHLRITTHGVDASIQELVV